MTKTDSWREGQQSTRGLLGRIRAGDRRALELLFTVHRERLSRALRMRLAPHGQATIDLEELIQETLLVACIRLETFVWRGEGAFLAWIVQIAMHKATDEARRRGARPIELRLDSPSAGSSIPELQLADERANPGAAVAQAEEDDLLSRALAQLSEQDRDLIVRRKILRQDYSSIAEDFGITPGAARMRVQRAMLKMSRWGRGLH